MKSPYLANANAMFAQAHTFRHEIFNKYVVSIGEDDCMIFRTRTRVDENGKLVSAHYGKIYGPWEFSTVIRIKDIYFNPTPNDLNLEDVETINRLKLLGR